MADFAPYIKFSQNSHYLTLPVQTVYPPSDVYGSDPRYRKVENLSYEGQQYINDPLYYIPADNLADEAEQPQDYDDWHNDCLIALRKKVDGEWVFDNKIIVFQHYTRWCYKKSNGNIRDWSIEMRVGLYDATSLTFSEWDHYIFGAGGIASAFEKVDAYVTAYNVPTLAGDQLIGPAYLFKVERTNGQENFKIGGFVLSKEWFNTNGYDDSAFREIDDPNEEDPEGPSGPGGGGGSHDPVDDPVPVPDPGPLPSAGAAGLVTLYKITLAQLKTLADVIYGADWVSIFKNIFNKPSDMLAGLMLLPITPPDDGHLYQPRLGLQNFGPNMPIVSQEFVQYDMGSLYIPEYYGGALDYSPASRLEIHLPFIGTRELDVDEVVGKTIGLKYSIDCYNGDCVAFISVYDSATQTYGVRYQFSGNCGQQIPVSGSDFTAIVGNAISLVATAGTAIATGGSSVPVEAAAGAVASSAANAVVNSKAHVSKSGNLGCATGLMAVLTPFITRTIPRQSLPEGYKSYEGYPLNMSGLLSSFSGFTVVDTVHLHGIPCTAAELAKIESLLKSGVIL